MQTEVCPTFGMLTYGTKLQLRTLELAPAAVPILIGCLPTDDISNLAIADGQAKTFALIRKRLIGMRMVAELKKTTS